MARPMTYFYTPEEPYEPETGPTPFFIDKGKDDTSARRKAQVKATTKVTDKITYGSQLHKIRIHSKTPFL